MSASAIWIIVALGVLGVEMFTGTIYLLAVFAGALAACAAAFCEFSFTAQLTWAAVVTLAGAATAFYFRRHLRNGLGARKLQDNDLDRGQRVEVKKVAADGTAQVNYRGAPWTAVPAHGELSPGFWLIERTDGPRLILERKIS
ncbi:MAG: hypothetical protein IJ228_12780 [Succinivibrio sp.]|nr:hypothetical protein [Succinivibrio sp.]